jgi:endoglucanase
MIPYMTATTYPADALNLGYGVNLSHWLAQHFEGTPDCEELFTKEDVVYLKEKGFGHIRLQIEESEMWDKEGKPIERKFQILTNAMEWLKDAGMSAILDLHILNCHHFNAVNGEGENTLFEKAESAQHFIEIWRQLSDRYKHYPNDFLAYEILNEAVAEDPEDWNRVLLACCAAIRELEPERILVIGSNRWQQPQMFPYLKVPENDKSILLSFHFYVPICFTHYTAHWLNDFADFRGPIQYPGYIVPPEYLEALPESPAKEMLKEFPYNDKKTLREAMMPAINYAKEHDLPLYCGEWGCLRTLPRDQRLQWHRDMSQILKEENLVNAMWEYKYHEFGIRHEQTNESDDELVDIILNG